MNKTIGEESKLVQALVPATRSSTTSGETAVDTLGFDNVCFSGPMGRYLSEDGIENIPTNEMGMRRWYY
jgi:hypothetical protein